jgi:hypothetical protein
MIIPFLGKPERTARENLAEYIRASRKAKFFSGPKALNWDDPAWNFSDFYPKVGRAPVLAQFTTLETTGQGNRKKDAQEFDEPFLSAARALTVEFLRVTGFRDPSKFAASLRLIEKAFRDLGLKPDICLLTPEVLDRAQAIALEKYVSSWEYGRFLERIAHEFVNPARIVAVPLLWKTSIKYVKPKRNDAVNKDGGAAGNTHKLPPLKAVLDLSGVFHTSERPEDMVVTSWFALAMFAPSRANEILSLPVDCATQINGKFGISWRPLKGGQPKTNFAVTEEWELIARSAIDRLKSLGQKSRIAAKWYEDNPDRLFLPPGMEWLRNQPITLWEAAQILGRSVPFPAGSKPRRSLEGVGTTRDISRGAPHSNARFLKLFSFRSLEDHVLENLPSGWPYIDEKRRLKASEGLFCLPSHLLRSNAETDWYMPSFISLNQIQHELGRKPSGETIFERHKLVDPKTGLAWKMTTHQPRHLLNTLAQSKHVSQELIAFWSGRKSVRQNEYYDHMPQEFYLEEWQLFDEQASRQIEVFGPLNEKVEERSRREMISRNEALRLELGSIITTRFGLCRHEFSLTGCPRDKDCINCGENTFIKGSDAHLLEALGQLEISRKAADLSRAEASKGRLGAERWVTYHEAKAARWQLAVDFLTDPDIPDGALITLPPVENPQSKTGLSTEIRKAELSEGASQEAGAELNFLDELWSTEEARPSDG